MSCRIVILYLIVTLSCPVFGQGSSERQAQQSIKKGKWEKAYAHLHHKVKDSLSVGNAYVQALYFFAPSNPDFQIDSADYYTRLAITGYSWSTPRQRERLGRFEIDSLNLSTLREAIDSAAFSRAKGLNTEESYLDFGVKFPQAAQQREAALLRDEVSYNDAQQRNTYQAFQTFLSKYPNALQASDARAKYERLLYETMTADKSLSSYKEFIQNHPGTTYQRESERHIFEIITASGAIESFKSYLQQFPSGHFSKRAQNILFHLIPDDLLRKEFPETLFSDSLRAVLTLEHDYLVPFLHDGKFGFMNHRGTVVIQPEATDIIADYRCGNITNDVLVLPTKLVALNGSSILNDSVAVEDDLGFGYLLLEQDTCMRVIHKSGFDIGDRCIDDARLLNGKLLALKRAGRWSIWTLTGRMLQSYIYDDVSSIKDVIITKSGDRITLQTISGLANFPGQLNDAHQVAVDEVKPWRNDFIWVRLGNDEGVLDQSLNTVINIEKHVLASTYFGSTAVASAGTQTFNDAGDGSTFFLKIVSQEPWTAVRNDLGWQLFDPRSKLIQSPLYDSILFTGPFAIGQKKDSLRVHFSPKTYLVVKRPAEVKFVSGKDSSSFVLVEQGKKKSLYTATGRKLFTSTFDRIQDAGEGFFIIQQNDKKGLINSEGKVLLLPQFDAFGTFKNGVVSVLQGTRFGLFDAINKKLIKPQYTKNLAAYNSRVVIAYKDDLCGFLGWDNRPIGNIEFNEIRYWNDTTALIKQDMQWKFYEIKTGKVVLDGIKDFSLLRDKPGDKLAVVHKDHSYGVIHSQNGIVIPMNFSDVINVGSSEEPLYFTEKHVEEASIFVVIYYDAGGYLVRKEVYEQDDYEKIYCSDN